MDMTWTVAGCVWRYLAVGVSRASAWVSVVAAAWVWAWEGVAGSVVVCVAVSDFLQFIFPCAYRPVQKITPTVK